MPRKPKKTREERVIENYFPVDIEDIKKTVEKKVEKIATFAKVKIEKQYKRPSRDELEKVEKISKKKPAPKRRKAIAKKKTYSHPKTK